MGLAVAGASERLHPIRESRQPEQIATAFGRRAYQESRGDSAIEDGLLTDRPRGKPGGIDHYVDLLRALHLKYFRDGAAKPRGGLPVDLVETFAGNVLAQLFELTAAAQLPHHVNAVDAAPQGLQVLMTAEIRIDANFNLLERLPPATRPKAERRPGSIKIACIDAVAAAPVRHPRPGELGPPPRRPAIRRRVPRRWW